jgi:hypothetical protein
VKIVVVAPMPSASVNVASAAKPGLRRSERQANRRSWAKLNMARFYQTAGVPARAK